MDQAILERIKTNMFPEESQDQPVETVTANDNPQEPEEDVQMGLEESAEAATEAEELSETVELVPESEDLAESSHEPEKWTLDEVAQSLDTSVDDLLNDWEIEVEGNKVKLGELKRGTLRESDYTKKTQALAEERRSFEDSKTRDLAELERQLSIGAHLIQGAKQALIGDYNEANMERLKEEDPDAWNIKDREFEKRANGIKHLEDQAIQQYNEYKQAKMADAPKERRLLLDAIPSFKEEANFDQGMRDITRYAQDLGYSDDFLAEQIDHRWYVLVHKAKAYDDLQSKKPAVEKKAKSAPKVLKPKGRKPTVSPEAKRQQELRKRLKKSGNVNDFAALIRNSM